MKDREKKPTGVAVANDDIRKLIIDNPDLPLVFIASDTAYCEDYSSMFFTDVSAYIGEMLDCQQEINDLITYTDREDFEEAVYEHLDLDPDFEGTEDEFDAELKRIIEEYEPYWRKVILVKVSN